MKGFCYSLIICLITLWLGCNKPMSESQQVKSLDSLGGALNAMLKELARTDTVLLQKYTSRFGYYSLFIKENVNDTLSKAEADNLKHFCNSGQSLGAFEKNRKLIVIRAQLVSAQLSKLEEYVKSSTEADLLNGFIRHEKAEIQKLTETGYKELRSFHASVEEFRNSLPGIDGLVRSRNNGKLPTIIKDTIVL